VTWNQDSQTLAAARGATLRIHDGAQERVVALDERQIRMGSLTYFPASDAVTVRLDPGIEVASTAPAEAPAQAVAPEPPPKPAARAIRPKKAQPRPFAAEGLLASHADSADRVELEPPPPLSPALLPRPAPVLIPPKEALPQTLARISYEAVQPHALRKVVNRIPGLRLLQKRQYRDVEDFRAATPVRTAPPAIPAGVAQQGTEVGLKILIDKAGEVQRAEVVSKDSNGRLEDLALSAVQSWKFAPARLEQEPVESEMIVRFDFDPVAASARASGGR
jgi:TonB family protein